MNKHEINLLRKLIAIGLIGSLFLVFITIPIYASNSGLVDGEKSKAKVGEQGKKGSVNFVLKSEDTLPLSEATNNLKYSTIQQLANRKGVIHEYYINNSTDEKFNQDDHAIQVTKLTESRSEDLQNYFINKFGFNALGLDSDGDDKLDSNESIVRDVNGDFQLTKSDRILKNGTVRMLKMNGNETVYFNIKKDREGYKSGLAVFSVNSERKLELGQLEKGSTRLLLEGSLPLTGFDDAEGEYYAYNNSKSSQTITSTTAIIEGNLSGELYSGKLNEGSTTLAKSGNVSMKEFERKSVFHIDAINSSSDTLNQKEALVKDTSNDSGTSIDSTDTIVKSGKAFVRLIGKNATTFGSGEIVIGNSSADQNYSEGEFLYAESGENDGYQQKEDIVISNRGNNDLTVDHDSKGTYTTLSRESKSNIAFLDMNKNDYLDIKEGANTKNGAEPVVRSSQVFETDGEILKTKSSVIEAEIEGSTYKSIEGNWILGENFLDLYNATGPEFDGKLRFIEPNNGNGDYDRGEVIIESQDQSYDLEKSDNVIIGGDLIQNSFEKIPLKYHFINVNHTKDYDQNYPIILINGRNENTAIDRDDRIVYSADRSFTVNYSDQIEYIDRDGSQSYSMSEPIIQSNIPQNNKLNFQDEIMNTESNPGRFDMTILGSYPNDANIEASYYLTKNMGDSYSRKLPVVSISPIQPINKDFGYQDKELIGFDKLYGYFDTNNNSLWDRNEQIYKENDAPAAGSDTYGDRITTVTVTNNGSLGDQYIETVTLRKNGTAIATTTSSRNGSWVLDPDPATAWFGPAGNGTAFSLTATVAADAPGGESLALEVPAVVDADSDGQYDSGDRGLFLAQGDPIGDIGPGATLRTTTDTVVETGPVPLGLAVEAPSENVSAAAETVSIEIRGNHSGRAVTARLRDLADNHTAARRTATLDAAGRASIEFDAAPGRYQVEVAAAKGEGRAQSGVFGVAPPGNVSVHSRSAAVDRGALARFGIALARAETARVTLQAANGSVLERAMLRADNGSSPYEIAVATDGTGGPKSGAGVRLEPPNESDAGLQWLTAPRSGSRKASQPGSNATQASNGTSASPNGTDGNRSAPETRTTPPQQRGNDGTGTDPKGLPAGSYSVVVTLPHGQSASATVRVGASWSATVTPLVAPREGSLEDAADVRAHATERDAIATGDRLVLAVEAGALEGYDGPIGVGEPPTHAAGRGKRGGNRTAGASPDNATNRPPAFVSVGRGSGTGGLNASNLRRIEANGSDRFFVVVAGGVESGPGSTLEAAMVLSEETPLVAPTPNGTATEARNVTVPVRAAKAEFDGVENDTLDLPAEAAVRIGGSTTVAPGTTATVHIEGANGSLDRERTVTVTEDGTYETTANLSGYEPGTEYTVSVTADGERLSPLRSGSFVGETDSVAAASGGGGGGSGGGVSSDRREPGSGVTGTETVTTTRPTASDPLPDPPELPDQALKRAWSRVPEPLRLGLPALLISALGSLAFFTVGRGILRLLRP